MKLTGIFGMVLACVGFAIVTAQETTPGVDKGSRERVSSPAERRAFIRDSLRQERIRARQQIQKAAEQSMLSAPQAIPAPLPVEAPANSTVPQSVPTVISNPGNVTVPSVPV